MALVIGAVGIADGMWEVGNGRFTLLQKKSVRNVAAHEMPVTVIGDPSGACQVAFPGRPRAFGLSLRIDAENDPRRLGPVCALRFGVQEPQVNDEMVTVVRRQCFLGRRLVGDGRIALCSGHL